jgi:hypothetical protein
MISLRYGLPQHDLAPTVIHLLQCIFRCIRIPDLLDDIVYTRPYHQTILILPAFLIYLVYLIVFCHKSSISNL